MAKPNTVDEIRDFGKDVFALLGELACKFANLEFFMSEILARLVDNKTSYVAGLICPDMPFRAKCECISRLALLRLTAHKKLQAELAQFCKSAEKIRKQRNLFIHGLWEFSESKIKAGRINCIDSRWRFSARATPPIKRLNQHEWKIPELKKYADQLGDIVNQGTHLTERLGKIELSTGPVDSLNFNVE